MFVLISIIAVICVGAPFGRPTETAELNKNIDENGEQILAAETTTVNAGQTYTVPKDGIYKIELHGGHGDDYLSGRGTSGDKFTGYIKLNAEEVLSTIVYEGGGLGYTHGGDGIGVSLSGTLLASSGGGAGAMRSIGNLQCYSCKRTGEDWSVLRLHASEELNGNDDSQAKTWPDKRLYVWICCMSCMWL